MSIVRRLAYSILLANLVLILGAGIGFFFGATFGLWWWGLYGIGGLIGASAFGEGSGFQKSAFRSNGLRISVALILHAVFLLAASGLASRFLDVGWDSLETHQRAVHLIREGWNIINPQPGWLGAQPEDGLLRKAPSVFAAYLDFNGMYIVSSLMGDLPFGFEGAKGYRILLLFMVAVVVGDLLRRAGLGRWAAGAVGLFVALNPVCMYQLWVLFMDFDVAVYSALSIVALYALSVRGDLRAIAVAVVALLLLLVSKRSGVAFSLPLGGFLALGILGVKLGWWEKGDDSLETQKALRWPRFLRSGKVRVISAIILVSVLGGLLWVIGSAGGSGQSRQGAYYSRGFVYRAIFEPDQFDKSLDLVVPESHQGLSRPIQFLRSLVEETDIYRGASVKVPLTWKPKEWDTFRNIQWPGHGAGGFGPLFSGVLLFSALAALVSLRPFPPKVSFGSLFRIALFLVLIGFCFVLPSWWARWVPFVWVLPLFFLLPPLFFRNQNPSSSRLLLATRNHWVPALCAGFALVLGVVNSVAILCISSGETLRVTRSIEEGLDSVSGQEIIFDPGRNLMTKAWLIDRGIDYRLSEDRGDLIFEMEPSTARLYQPAVSQ